MAKYLFLVILIGLSCNISDHNKSQLEDLVANNKDEIKAKTYLHLDSIPMLEWRLLHFKDSLYLDSLQAFLYQGQEDEIRLAARYDSLWLTWEIFNEDGQSYDATLERVDFDKKGLPEIVVRAETGIRPQSTFGNEFYGHTEMWNVDSLELMFEVAHYEYMDDAGRNGDNTYSIKCELPVQFEKGRIQVGHQEDFHLKEKNYHEKCNLDWDRIGIYELGGDGRIFKIK